MGKIYFKLVFSLFFGISSIFAFYDTWFMGKDMPLASKIGMTLWCVLCLSFAIIVFVRNVIRCDSDDFEEQEMKKRAKKEEKRRLRNERRRTLTVEPDNNSGLSKAGKGILIAGGLLTYFCLGTIGSLTSKYTKKRR